MPFSASVGKLTGYGDYNFIGVSNIIIHIVYPVLMSKHGSDKGIGICEWDALDLVGIGFIVVADKLNFA
jgi:hypothetical protein